MSGGKSQQSSQQVTVPPDVLARYNSVNAQAQTAASQPFQQYSSDPNAFVAPLTPTQQAGIANTNTAAGQAQPYFDAATQQLTGAQQAATPFIYGAAQGTQEALQQGTAANQQAAGLYGAGLAAGAPMIAASGAAADAAPITGQTIGQYMDPYLSSVVGNTAALQNQQNQQAMAGQTGNAIRQGAFGGDRAGIAAANLQGQQNLATGNLLSGLLSQGYGQALSTAQQQQGVNLGAQQANLARLGQAGQGLAGLYGSTAAGLGGLGQQQYAQGTGSAAQQAAIGNQLYGMGAGTSQALAGLGAGAQGAALQGAQAQLAAGQAEQQTQQAGNTALYNQFLQKQSYPFQVAQFLANIAEGTGALSGSTTTTTQPGGFFSDERLKEDIEPIGKTFDGQNIVKFRYKGEPRKQIGLIAQDVEKHHPDAVGLASGYKTVDYDKATEDAADRGRFYRGGLVPSSEGGAVTTAHMGEGFAGGGPALPNATDMAALLAAQAHMFGPFSQGGLYGGESGGVPGGGSGRVPAANLPVSHLAVAGELPKATTTAEQMAQIASAGENINKFGQETGLWKGKPPSDTAPAATVSHDEVDNRTAEQRAAEFGLGAGNGYPISDPNDPYGPSARGGVAGGRHHYADGGMPYSEQTSGPTKRDIPDEQKEAPKLATAGGLGGGGGGGDGGLIGGISKLAGMGSSLAGLGSSLGLFGSAAGAAGAGGGIAAALPFLAALSTGGVAGGRKGYAGRGAVNNDDGSVSMDMSDGSDIPADMFADSTGTPHVLDDRGPVVRKDIPSGFLDRETRVAPPLPKFLSPKEQVADIPQFNIAPDTSTQAPAPVAPPVKTGVVAAAPVATPAAAPDFNSAFNQTMRFEGGNALNPSEGSRFGVVPSAHPGVDVANLTKEGAADIYRNEYWNPIGADKMSPQLAPIAADTAYHLGVRNTKPLLEQAGGDPNKLLDLRQQYYNDLVSSKPDKYGPSLKGWTNRVNQLRATLSPAAAPAAAPAGGVVPAAAPAAQPPAVQAGVTGGQPSPAEQALIAGAQRGVVPQGDIRQILAQEKQPSTDILRERYDAMIGQKGRQGDGEQPDMIDRVLHRIAPQGGYLDRLTSGDADTLIPFLTGLAAMGTAPTRNLGVALASGVGAGAKSSQAMREFDLRRQQMAFNVASSMFGPAQKGVLFGRDQNKNYFLNNRSGQLVSEDERAAIINNIYKAYGIPSFGDVAANIGQDRSSETNLPLPPKPTAPLPGAMPAPQAPQAAPTAGSKDFGINVKGKTEAAPQNEVFEMTDQSIQDYVLHNYDWSKSAQDPNRLIAEAEAEERLASQPNQDPAIAQNTLAHARELRNTASAEVARAAAPYIEGKNRMTQESQTYAERKSSEFLYNGLANILEKFQSGRFAGTGADLDAWYSSITGGKHLPADLARGQISADKAESFIKEQMNLVYKQLNTLKGRILDKEIQGMTMASPETTKQPAANRTILGQFKGAFDYANAKYEAERDYTHRNGGLFNETAFNREWFSNPENRVQNFVDKATKSIAVRGGTPDDVNQLEKGQAYIIEPPSNVYGKSNFTPTVKRPTKFIFEGYDPKTKEMLWRRG